MGLVALKTFLGNEGRRYQPGEPCPEALSWRYPALCAAISQGLIEDKDGAVRKHFGADTRRERHKDVTGKAASVALAPAPVAPSSAEAPTEPIAMVLTGQVACADCDRIFESKRAVSMHRLKAHKLGARRA